MSEMQRKKRTIVTVGTESLRALLEVQFALHKENPEFSRITPVKLIGLSDFSAGGRVGRRAVMRGTSEALNSTCQLDKHVWRDMLNIWFVVGVIVRSEVVTWEIWVIIIRRGTWGVTSRDVWMSWVVINHSATERMAWRLDWSLSGMMMHVPGVGKSIGKCTEDMEGVVRWAEKLWNCSTTSETRRLLPKTLRGLSLGDGGGSVPKAWTGLRSGGSSNHSKEGRRQVLAWIYC